MNFWDYLDRAGERRVQRPLDTRLIIGFGFLAGYYALIFYLAAQRHELPNGDMVRDALLVLGPPVGAIVAALFRTDARDEQLTQNTRHAFSAIEATAKASGSTPALAVEPAATVDTRKNPDGSTTQTITGPLTDPLDAGELPEGEKL